MVKALYSIHLLSVLRKHLAIGQFSFFSAFHWLPSIGKPCMTLVSFINMESYKILLVTINRQTLHDSSILYQHWNLPRFADESYEVCRLGHYLGSTFTRTD